MGLTGKEYHLKFTRENGHYKINAVRVDSQAYKAPGLLHRVDRLRERFEGDVPKLSLTRKIDSLNPKTTFGKSAKVTLKALNGTGKLAAGAAWKTALGAETAATSMGAVAVNHFRQELRQNADTLDTGKAVLSGATTLRTINGARKTLVMHRLKKNQYKLLKSELPGLKEAKVRANKLYKQKKMTFKVNQKAYKSKLKAVHKGFGKKTNGAKIFKIRQKFEKNLTKHKYNTTRNISGNFKIQRRITRLSAKIDKLRPPGKPFNFKKLNVNRKGLRRNRLRIRSNIHSQKSALKKLKHTDRKIKNLAKKQYKNKKKLKRLSKPKSLVRSAAGGVMGGALNKATTKISQDAADNDFVKAGQKVNNLHRQVKAHKKRVQGRKLNKMQKKASSQKLNKRQNKLNQRRTKLQRQSQMKKHKKRKPKPKKKAAEKAKELAGQALKFIGKMFSALAAPLLIIVFFFAIVLTIFGGISSNNSAVAGTYYCCDYDMSLAIEEYTANAYELNEQLIKLKNGDSSWKDIIKRLQKSDGEADNDVSDMKDTPSDFIFGNNIVQAYDPVYDYDPNKLIAFMCAYCYDFNNSDEKQNWNYSDDKYADVLQKLLDTEYTVEYEYVNGSYWQPISRYDVYPGDASDELYFCTATGDTEGSDGNTYGYLDFGSYYDDVSALITKYCDGKRLYFDLSTGEIKDASDDSYDETGYYLQNMNSPVNEPDGNQRVAGFYENVVINGSRQIGFKVGSTAYPKTQLTLNGSDFNWAVSADDVNKKIGVNASAVRIYRSKEYITDCTLYVNVKQNCTFEEAIKEVLKDASKNAAKDDNGNVNQETYQEDYGYRLQYYNIIAGNPDDTGKTLETYGLHQIFKNSPLAANFEDVTVYNGYGYDMAQWGVKHCDNTGTHYGNDYEANVGDSVYSLIDGKITDINTGDHSITVETTENINFWFDNDSEHTVRVTYENVSVLSSLKKDDEVSAGDKIGTVDNYRHCAFGSDSGADTDYLHVSVEVKYSIFDWDWHNVDPYFLIYRQNG